MSADTVDTVLLASAHKLDELPYPQLLECRVLELGQLIRSGGMSPVECALILARTASSNAMGLGLAIAEGNLHPTDITDRDELRHVIVALRATADIHEAVLRAGAA